MRQVADTPKDQHPSDTIVAIATPPGQGGVGIVRLSGPEARRLGLALFHFSDPTRKDFTPRMLHHGSVLDATGQPVDEALAVLMPGPRSFTGEDVLELHCHGSSAVLRAVLDAALALGARMAGRGEFTKRAFLNGRLDLSQAEAVAELIAAPDRAAAHLARARLTGLLGERVRGLRSKLERLRAELCLAVDFPEEDIECLDPERFLSETESVASGVRGLLAAHERTRVFREGAVVVLAGPVNAGKSSLLNALLGRERAIVSDAPGTTRDWLEESVSLDGLPVRLVDTAGLRETADTVELEGVRRSRELLDRADLVLLVLDATRPVDDAAAALAHEIGPQRILLVLNKADLLKIGEGVALPEPHPPGSAAPWTHSSLRPEEPAEAPASPEDAGVRGESFDSGHPGPRPAGVAGAATSNRAVLHDCPPAAGGILNTAAWRDLAAEGFQVVAVSAHTGQGVDALVEAVRGRLTEAAGGEPQSDELAPNARQARAMRAALDELAGLCLDIRSGLPYDLLGVRLETACAQLGEVTGEIAPQDVLDAIFDTFCIGK